MKTLSINNEITGAKHASGQDTHRVQGAYYTHTLGNLTWEGKCHPLVSCVTLRPTTQTLKWWTLSLSHSAGARLHRIL